MSSTAIWPRTGRTAPAGRSFPETWRVHAPAASTTAPAPMRPDSWSTPITRPPSTAMPRTWPCTKVAPARAAAACSARPSSRGSTEASPGNQSAPRVSGERPGSSRRAASPSSTSTWSPARSSWAARPASTGVKRSSTDTSRVPPVRKATQDPESRSTSSAKARHRASEAMHRS